MKINEKMEQLKKAHKMEGLEFLLQCQDEFSDPVLSTADMPEIAVYVKADFPPPARNNEVHLTEYQEAALERAMELFKWGYSACVDTDGWVLKF